MSDYTQTPNKLRIVRDPGMIALADVDTDPNVWQLDGIDTREQRTGHDGRTWPNCTEQVWNFPTFADAVAAMPEFVGALADELPDVRCSLLEVQAATRTL